MAVIPTLPPVEPLTTSPSTSSTPTSVSTTTPLLPPLPIPITSSTTTTSSSSSTTSTTSTTTTSSTSTSSSSITTTSTTPTVPTTTTSQHIITTPSTTLPAVITEVSTTFVSASQSSTSSAAAAQATTHSFFSNKGAVAGVFSVVGLFGVVILVALFTNAIRRHRAKKFDKELFAATQEAAATAPDRNFLDDDDDSEVKRNYGPGYGGGGNGYNGKTYSEGSHGQYGQPPMEVYNMRDMVGHNVPVGEIYDPYAAGGAAGIGVARARSANTKYSNVTPNIYAAALQEGGSPYPKFAIGPNDTYPSGGTGAPLGRGPSNPEIAASRGRQQQSPPPPENTALGRSKSNSIGATHVSAPSLSHSPSYSQQQQQQPYPVRQMSPPRPTAAPGFPTPHTQVYPTHKVQPSGGSTTPSAAYGGLEEEEEEKPRVLKVANEA